MLLVEDDDGIAEPLVEGLTREGFRVTRVGTGAEALSAPVADLVILDLGLPDMDGYTVCQELRARSAVPILVVSARGAEVDRVVGLELGADDYIVKPFGFRELVARIRAVMRRLGDAPAGDGVQDLGMLVLDRRTRRVHVSDREIYLSPKEFDLLALLVSEAGHVVTRKQCMDRIWRDRKKGDSRTLDTHVKRLRKKIESNPAEPEHLITVRGVGYRFKP